MNNNQNHQKPKKKYSGALFLENDEFNCFVDSHGNKIQKPNAKSFQQGEMSQEQAGGAQTEQNILNSIGGYNNQYYNMYNNSYQNSMFPMVQVPMNMPLLNMMNFGNMLYNMNNEQSNFDTSFNHFMNLPVEEIMAGFEETVLDQKGCKQLQARVENDGSESKLFEAIFEKVVENFREYAENQFANYFCQKIIELCTKDQLRKIVERIMPEIVETSKTNHGTRVIQKIIENLIDENLVGTLMKRFESHVVELVLDVNGNHVIQKCLSYFPAEKVAYMYTEIMNQAQSVATHKYGCCVLQRCIDYCSDEQIDDVIGGILDITANLLNDKYGNYVIQYILELQGYDNYKKVIGENINKNIVYYCYQKYSSNVVEKCLKVDVKIVFDKLIEVWKSEEEVTKMICDQFGNYVVQTSMMRNRSSPKVNGVLKNIKKNSETIKNSPIGEKVLLKLGRIFNFWAEGDDVTLKDNQEYTKRKYRKGGGGGFKKNYSGGNYKKGYNNYKKKGHGYVNMNMNLNFNVNLNYQNQGNNGGNGNGNGNFNGGNGNSWE